MKSMFKGTLSALVVVLALSGLTAASALAAGAPTAETRKAIEVHENEASLTGYVNPNGVETKLWFEYGPTTSYGSKTKEQTTTVVKEPIKTVTGLTRGTTYHFRLVASNSYGTSYGADETFTTTKELPEAVVSEGSIREIRFAGSGEYAVVGWEGNKSMSCNSQELTAEFLNSREVEGRMRIHGCWSGEKPCTNGNETIETEPLKGKLAYTNKTKKEVGLILEGKSSNVWAKNVNCAGIVEPILGKLAGELTLEVNKKIPLGTHWEVKYQMSRADEQLAGELTGQLYWGRELESYRFGLEGPFRALANKAFEIKA